MGIAEPYTVTCLSILRIRVAFTAFLLVPIRKSPCRMADVVHLLGDKYILVYLLKCSILESCSCKARSSLASKIRSSAYARALM